MVEILKLTPQGYAGELALNCLFCGKRVEAAVSGPRVPDAYAAATGGVPAVFAREGEAVAADGRKLELLDVRLRCPHCQKHFPVKARAL